ncbi:hypothetical protein [Allostreptomyces psammosilenae]|uniref:Uncharacterized protein n=1 Tax=Allostreptomyces psammosilenae TaxID=1892865 RepID=A0A852ZYB9_9ACTN|nr:hypothetical protein [Allostreptomyces psammosilenae]NYI06220.1 hypothetical protein [Allostreptomyces psammosilenae]
MAAAPEETHPPLMPDPFLIPFEQEVIDLVNESSPRMFAVVQVFREEEDARVAAWGMAFGDRAYVISCDSAQHYRLRSPESAIRFFTHPDITARILWRDTPPRRRSAHAKAA